MTIINSPLEQFSVFKLFSLQFWLFDFSFTNSSLLAVFAFIIPFVFINLLYSKVTLIPSSLQSLVEFLYEFLLFNVLKENVKKQGEFFFSFLFTLFFFIFTCNLLGMIPYSFTVTSHIVVTLGLAFTSFFAINVVAIRTHGFHFLSFFLPSGAPLILAPLLVVIEVVSYSFRVISLALRLFANMMSGHCLLKILAGFSWTMLSSGGILTALHIFPIIVIFFIIGLELAIAFLQAYVFCVLFSIYLNDAISLH